MKVRFDMDISLFVIIYLCSLFTTIIGAAIVFEYDWSPSSGEKKFLYTTITANILLTIWLICACASDRVIAKSEQLDVYTLKNNGQSVQVALFAYDDNRIQVLNVTKTISAVVPENGKVIRTVFKKSY